MESFLAAVDRSCAALCSYRIRFQTDSRIRSWVSSGLLVPELCQSNSSWMWQTTATLESNLGNRRKAYHRQPIHKSKELKWSDGIIGFVVIVVMIVASLGSFSLGSARTIVHTTTLYSETNSTVTITQSSPSSRLSTYYVSSGCPQNSLICTSFENRSQALIFNCLAAASSLSGCDVTVNYSNYTTSRNYSITVWYPITNAIENPLGNNAKVYYHLSCPTHYGNGTTIYSPCIASEFDKGVALNSTSFILYQTYVLEPSGHPLPNDNST